MRRPLLPLIVALVGCGSSHGETTEDSDAAIDTFVPSPSADTAIEADTSTPPLGSIADQTVAEDALLEVPIDATDVHATGLPPGARIEGRKLVFRPDFIQGSAEPWTVTVHAGTAETKFRITVQDTIKPPALVVAKTEDLSTCRRITLTQKTDAYTDSPGHAGRTFTAIATVPKAATSTPIRVVLHGVGGAPSTSLGCSSSIVIAPHDPNTTYWWGYSDKLPSGTATSGTVPPYTARRVLQLVEWAVRTQNGDATRTFISGGSMGGAGSMTIGLLWARHFAGVDATLGQAIPRNHRPDRLATLEKIWGTRALNLDDGAGMGVWDRQDLTRVLRDEPEAAGQFIFLKHGKDDPTIHFGAVTIASPLTKLTFYQALRGHPHYAVWDEGAHGPADPVMGDGWWDGGWSRITDATAFVRLDRVVPAFFGASHDGNPGDGTGNGKVKWDPDSGYSADVAVAGDTGWTGDIAGAINRHLRWDASKSVDESDRIELPLRVFSGTGKDPPRAGYPTIDDKVAAKLPVIVDVTLRRVQRFFAPPGSSITYELGTQKGEAIVGTNGEITLKRLELGTAWATLIVRRKA